MADVQLSIAFDQEEASGLFVPRTSEQPLRPYQQEADAGTHARLLEFQSTLVVMATGTGKTTTFAHLAHHWPEREYAKELSDRVLVLSHREEILFQARERLAKMTGEFVGLEKAEARAGLERIVVASVQTLYSEDRLNHWKPDDFGLVIYDEAHHACSPKNKRIVEHFTNAKVVGYTATPDRADEKAMGQVFVSDPPAFVYDIDDAINDGWLVEPVVHNIYLGELDLSACRTTAGDLNQADLDAAMVEEAIAHMVKVTVEESGDLKTLLFTTSVDNATRMAELLNSLKAGAAKTVNAKTPVDLRRIILREFEDGAYQYLSNVGIATEGYDCPPVACVAQGRPTKSRSLHAQIIGRGLRPIFPAGFNPNTATPAERKAAIASSTKPHCRVLEFTGNSGKHSLACTVDILGGKYGDDVVAAAKKKVAENPGTRAGDALEQAQAEIETRKRNEAARKLLAQAKTNYSKRILDPFEVFGIKRTKEDAWSDRFGGSVATEGQLKFLKSSGVVVTAGLTKHQASRLCAAIRSRSEQGKASFAHIQSLGQYGIPAHNLSYSQAQELTMAVIKAGWKRPSQDVYDRIVNRERTAGEDG